MRNIKVLGTGCANCKTTLKLIEETARSSAVEIDLEKVEDLAEILGFGVLSTPGVVVDGKVVHSGGIPTKANIETWLASNETDSNCCSGTSESGSGCCG